MPLLLLLLRLTSTRTPRARSTRWTGLLVRAWLCCVRNSTRVPNLAGDGASACIQSILMRMPFLRQLPHCNDPIVDVLMRPTRIQHAHHISSVEQQPFLNPQRRRSTPYYSPKVEWCGSGTTSTINTGGWHPFYSVCCSSSELCSSGGGSVPHQDQAAVVVTIVVSYTANNAATTRVEGGRFVF